MRYCKLCGAGRLTAELRWGVLYDAETLTPVSDEAFRYALWRCPECGEVGWDYELDEAAEVRDLLARERRFSRIRSNRPPVVCEDCGIACWTDMILRPRPGALDKPEVLYHLHWRCMNCDELYYEDITLPHFRWVVECDGEVIKDPITQTVGRFRALGKETTVRDMIPEEHRSLFDEASWDIDGFRYVHDGKHYKVRFELVPYNDSARSLND